MDYVCQNFAFVTTIVEATATVTEVFCKGMINSMVVGGELRLCNGVQYNIGNLF